MPHLLIAYDGSEGARSAVRAAAGLFPGAPAVVLFAHDEPPRFERTIVHSGTADPSLVQRGVAELADEVAARATRIAEQGASLATEHGLAAEPAIVATRGGVWREVLSTAAERDTEVVVCGTRGRGSLGRALLGSTATSLLHHADRSMLVVPDGEFTTDGPVMIAFDGSEDAQAAVVRAAELFPGRAAVVVHGWRSPLHETISGRALLAAPIEDMRGIAEGLEELMEANAQAVADDGCDLARQHGLDARAELAGTRRSAWQPLIDAAEAADACVVIAGSRGRGGVASALLGSVSGALVSNAVRATLVVRRPAG